MSITPSANVIRCFRTCKRILKNSKIIPIFLTVVSTILGFIPFMIGQGKEAFWFPLAAGTIGGLIASILGIFMFLPIFSLKKQKKRMKSE